MPELMLIRGVPGTGKSTLAQKMAKLGYKHLETDQLRYKDGNYVYDPQANDDLHTEIFKLAKLYLEQGHDVVVANTFVKRWQMQPYYDLGYPITEIMMLTERNNIHDVPQWKIDQMKRTWEF